MTTAPLTAIVAHAIGDYGIARAAVDTIVNEIGDIPTVANADDAAALHGPWQVLMSDHHGVLCGPLDLDEHDKPYGMTISINRIHPTGVTEPCTEVAYYKTGFGSLAEVHGTYLRAQAMCAGLNLTSAANGIDITGSAP